uniref:Protein FAM47E n=1 Tax=Myotis lucifugus TaxID=59463 RepID=G1Q6F0_MYOLU
PWFKDRDRLPSRYLSRQNNKLGKCPTSMDSRRWVFVKEGLDDFRTGCPSPEDVITRGPREGFLPMIAHRIPRPPPKKIHRQPPKGADLCSKLSPAQRARKAFVENIEGNLTQHSLANCPNLEEALPPDLMLKVLEVVDPDRELEDTWAYCEGTKERKKTPTHLCEEHSEEVNLEPPQAVNLEPPEAVNLEPPEAVNLEPPEAVHSESPWKLNLEPPEDVNLEPENQAHVETAKVPGLQQSRRRVREFCRWIDDNFGDIGIDEEDIMKQFGIDLEVPLTHNTVKIKKISQLPLNIKPCKQLDDIQQRKFSLQEGNWERKLRKQQDPYKPKREKIRYGAWYLDPKCWKKVASDQPLPDPIVVRDKEYWTYLRHFEPDIIDELYGPIAFKDFIVSKGYKMPGVIEKMF